MKREGLGEYMKIEDFGFQPVMGKEYVVTFSKDDELLSNSIYNGADLPPVAFPDNAKINLTITDRTTGKHLMSSEFISYNGKLYKSVFDLPLKNTDSNKNANIFIKDLHYDLTTGSVLVQVQGFKGDNYKLNVSDSTLKHKVVSIPIVLEDDMYYSIPTELVQGNKFEVLLQDEHGKSIDLQEFTAPISTDWRYTDTVEAGTLELDEVDPNINIDQQGVGQEQLQTQESLLPESSVLDNLGQYKTPVIIGGFALAVILLLVLILRLTKRRKGAQSWEDHEEYEEVDPDREGVDQVEDWVDESAEEDSNEENHNERNQNSNRSGR